MTNPQLEAAQSNAQRTYDRRRARSFAEGLANIPPNRWDDATRSIIITLATLAIPSRIDDNVDAAFNDGYIALDGQPEPGTDLSPYLADPCIDPVCPRRYENHIAHVGEAAPPGPVVAVPIQGPCIEPCGQADCDVACSILHDNGDYRA